MLEIYVLSRLEGGEIVERSDVHQPEPPATKGGNRMTLGKLSTGLTLACWAMLVGSLSGCIGSSGRLPPVPLAIVDMPRMYGGWYLIATRKNWFEKYLVGPYDVYTQRSDGDIQEDFYVRTHSFTAPLKHFVLHDWVRPNTHNAHWRVQIFWPLNLPFLILYVDPSYRYVMFGEENRKLGWIYSRTPTIPDEDYQDLIARFAALGYETASFVKFVQVPEQLGKEGVWDEGIH